MVDRAPVAGAVPPEEQVARQQHLVVDGLVARGVELVGGHARDGDARVAVGRLREPGAVEGARALGAPLVGLAELREGVFDGLLGLGGGVPAVDLGGEVVGVLGGGLLAGPLDLLQLLGVLLDEAVEVALGRGERRVELGVAALGARGGLGGGVVGGVGDRLGGPGRLERLGQARQVPFPAERGQAGQVGELALGHSGRVGVGRSGGVVERGLGGVERFDGRRPVGGGLGEAFGAGEPLRFGGGGLLGELRDLDGGLVDLVGQRAVGGLGVGHRGVVGGLAEGPRAVVGDGDPRFGERRHGASEEDRCGSSGHEHVDAQPVHAHTRCPPVVFATHTLSKTCHSRLLDRREGRERGSRSGFGASRATRAEAASGRRGVTLALRTRGPRTRPRDRGHGSQT